VPSHALNVVMPVALLSFNVQGFKSFNAVSWQTATEINTDHFNIQKSIDGKDFNTVGKVNAKGSGSYLYDDLLTTDDSGFMVLYYRLEITDKDGSKTYSEIRQLNMDKGQWTIKLTPNPARTYFTVNGHHIAAIKITDITGRVMNNTALNDAANPAISLSGLSAGMYYIAVYTKDGKMYTEKLMKE